MKQRNEQVGQRTGDSGEDRGGGETGSEKGPTGQLKLLVLISF